MAFVMLLIPILTLIIFMALLLVRLYVCFELPDQAAKSPERIWEFLPLEMPVIPFSFRVVIPDESLAP